MRFFTVDVVVHLCIYKWNLKVYNVIMTASPLETSQVLAVNTSQASICDDIGCISAHGLGMLHTCESYINADWCMQVWSNTCFSGQCLCQQDNTQQHFAGIATSRLHFVWRWEPGLPGLLIFHSLKMQSRTNETLNCWGAEMLHQVRMGKRYTLNLVPSFSNGETVRRQRGKNVSVLIYWHQILNEYKFQVMPILSQ